MNWWQSGIETAIGSFIGVLTGFLITVMIDWRRQNEARKVVRRLLAIEHGANVQRAKDLLDLLLSALSDPESHQSDRRSQILSQHFVMLPKPTWERTFVESHVGRLPDVISPQEAEEFGKFEGNLELVESIWSRLNTARMNDKIAQASAPMTENITAMRGMAFQIAVPSDFDALALRLWPLCEKAIAQIVGDDSKWP